MPRRSRKGKKKSSNTKKVAALENPNRRDLLTNLLISPREKVFLQKIADEMSGGNVAAWIRQRALRVDVKLEADFQRFLQSLPDEDKIF